MIEKTHNCRPKNWKSSISGQRPYFNFDYPYLFLLFLEANFYLLEGEDNFCAFEQYIMRKKILSRVIEIEAIKDSSGEWIKLSFQGGNSSNKFLDLVRLCFYAFLTNLRKMNFREKFFIYDEQEEEEKKWTTKYREYYQYNYVGNLGDIGEPSLDQYFRRFIAYVVSLDKKRDEFSEMAKDWVQCQENVRQEAEEAFFSSDDLDCYFSENE